MADGTSSGKTLLERLQIGVSILLALAAGYSAWQMNATEKSLKETERSLKTRESERKDSEETRADRESIEKKQLLMQLRRRRQIAGKRRREEAERFQGAAGDGAA